MDSLTDRAEIERFKTPKEQNAWKVKLNKKAAFGGEAMFEKSKYSAKRKDAALKKEQDDIKKKELVECSFKPNLVTTTYNKKLLNN